MKNPSENRDLLKGLDSIRFFAAIWVVFGHFGVPKLSLLIDKSTTAGLILNGIYNNSISGPSAVIVFFVISGVCIHYPHSRCNRIPSVSAYFARRYIRILLPVVAALIVAKTIAPIRLSLFEQSILWSLLAELIYYTLYPLFLWLRRSMISWTLMIAIALLLGIAVAATNPAAGNYPSYGATLNWLLGLPCWLLGCKLAEHIRTRSSQQIARPMPDPSTRPIWSSIWTWRAGVFILSMLCSAARFHSPIGYPWTLNLFAIAVAFWLMREVHHFKLRDPPRAFEWAGTWSYSIYLGHLPAMKMLWMVPTAEAGVIGLWLIHMLIILSLSYVFYLFVELPSHILARAASGWIRNQKDRSQGGRRLAG